MHKTSHNQRNTDRFRASRTRGWQGGGDYHDTILEFQLSEQAILAAGSSDGGK